MMKRIYLFLFLLTVSLMADDGQPIEFKVDSAKIVREQLAKAREKGWDSSTSKKQPALTPSTPIEFKFQNSTPFSHMDKSQALSSLFRSDMPETQKGPYMDQLNESERKPSRKK
jgi:hypothetical protein